MRRAAEIELELVCDGLAFPEAPVALADGSVLVAEIRGECLTRIASDGRKTLVAHVAGGPNGLAIGPDGAIWITNNGGAFAWRDDAGLCLPGPAPSHHVGGMIQRYDPVSGRLETIYDGCGGKRLMAPNDLVFDQQGGFWFTDYGVETDDGKRFGAVYHAAADGSRISLERASLLAPNGIGLSPDQTVLYVADTILGLLWAFDIEAPGRLAPQTGWEPGRAVAKLPGILGLDSLAVEAAGNICVATLLDGGITVFGPGGSLRHHPVPDPICTNICFGGDDMRTAWITASATGKLYRTRWPRPGLKLSFNA